MTPLYNDMTSERFHPASEYENLIEERLLIGHICDSLEKLSGQAMRYEGFHDYIAFHLWGTLPRDRAKMIAALDQKIEEYAAKKDVTAVIDQDHAFEMRSAY